MIIKYEISGAGWATALIGEEERLINVTVSYLHDSLKELADAAIKLKNGAPSATIIFMDEPGEHQLLIERVNDNDIVCELRWYADWASWGMYSSDQYRSIYKASTELHYFVEQVKDLLEDIFQTIGIDEYKKKWIKHEFPMKELEILTAA
jgi:hypothetical protein